jgi:hypothetical protein
MNRDTESVVVLAPNIGLNLELLLLRPGSIGIDATLDFGETLVMAVNHSDDRNRTTNQDRANRNQQAT